MKKITKNLAQIMIFTMILLLNLQTAFASPVLYPEIFAKNYHIGMAVVEKNTILYKKTKNNKKTKVTTIKNGDIIVVLFPADKQDKAQWTNDKKPTELMTFYNNQIVYVETSVFKVEKTTHISYIDNLNILESPIENEEKEVLKYATVKTNVSINALIVASEEKDEDEFVDYPTHNITFDLEKENQLVKNTVIVYTEIPERYKFNSKEISSKTHVIIQTYGQLYVVAKKDLKNIKKATLEKQI